MSLEEPGFSSSPQGQTETRSRWTDSLTIQCERDTEELMNLSEKGLKRETLQLKLSRTITFAVKAHTVAAAG